MSFFDRRGIPEALLRSRDEQKESDDYNSINNDTDYGDNDWVDDNTSQSNVSDGFKDDVLTLQNYSFISINTNRTTFEMHGLIQLARRK